ncbi:Protein of unknown function [Bacillus cereus]|nr:Protein of unknown function [Bacillus cereus]
MDGAKVNQNR